MSRLVPKPPCFDESTRTDCPKRKVSCRSECEEWQQYERDRMIFYKEHKLDSERRAMKTLSQKTMRTFYKIRNGR